MFTYNDSAQLYYVVQYHYYSNDNALKGTEQEGWTWKGLKLVITRNLGLHSATKEDQMVTTHLCFGRLFCIPCFVACVACLGSNLLL